MFNIKSYKEANILICGLSGDLDEYEVDSFLEELAETIESSMKVGFTYVLDIERLNVYEIEKDSLIYNILESHRVMIEEFGAEDVIITGAKKETMEVVFEQEKNSSFVVPVTYYDDIEVAIDYLSERLKKRGK